MLIYRWEETEAQRRKEVARSQPGSSNSKPVLCL